MYFVCQRMAFAHSIKELTEMTANSFLQEGISSLAFTYYRKHTKTGSKLIFDWATKPLRPWHQHYINQGYADIDRTLEAIAQSLLPVYWDVNQQLPQSKNKREARIRQESIDFGINKGLSISIYGPGGDFLVLVIHQRIDEKGLEGWEEKQYKWTAIAQCYLHYLRQFLLNKSHKNLNLTQREQQCLKLTSQGLRIDNIAEVMDISRRTVNFHLQNANKKLGVTNKYLAIIRWQELEDKSS
ncbi:MAG: LuxR family transcriptional regulator [Tatlockia sp.]|nr:LuxR family transcriptional regulator [Tatlockia sp.]